MGTNFPTNSIGGMMLTKSDISDDRKENAVKIEQEYTLDEAIEATKIGKFQSILVILAGLNAMGATIENVNFSFILPYAKCDLKLSIAEQSALSSVSFLGIVSTSYLWGFLLDTWGRKKVLCLTAFCGFFLSIFSTFATNTIILIALRFFAGAFLSGSQAGSFTYVSEFFTSKTASQAVAYSSTLVNFMGIIMALLAMVIIPMDWVLPIFGLDFRPWRLFLICTSLLNLWNGIVLSFLPETPKFLLAMNEKEEALKVLQKIYAYNTGEPKESYPVKSIQTVTVGMSLAETKGIFDIIKLLWSQTKPLFVKPLLPQTWKLCYLTFVSFTIGHGTYMWFPHFLIQLQNYNGPQQILCAIVKPKTTSDDYQDECDNLDNKNILTYEILLGVTVFFLLSSIGVSYLLKRISPKTLIGTWMMISASTCIAMNFLVDFNAIVFSFMMFLSCCSCAGIIMAVSVNLFPIKYRGMASAFLLMFGRLGGFAGSNLVGMLLAFMCTMIFYINSGLLISCILMLCAIKFENESESDPDADSKTDARKNTANSVEPV